MFPTQLKKGDNLRFAMSTRKYIVDLDFTKV